MLLRILGAFSLLLALYGPAFAENFAIADFYGTFEGEGSTLSEEGTTGPNDRVAYVEIAAVEDGFSVAWTTLMLNEPQPSLTEGRVKTAELIFKPAGENVWHSTKNGKPGDGKPWSWARLDGDTLIITTLLLRANGTYDITSYERTLKSKDLMELRFTRFKDGDITRRVKADLARK